MSGLTVDGLREAVRVLDAAPKRCCVPVLEWVGGDKERAEELENRLREWHERHGVPLYCCDRT